jgi:hypothetical protein
VSDFALEPNEAIRLLYHAIGQPGVVVVPKYVAHDLASLRRAHTDDADYANAIHAVAREFLIALRSPTTHGVDAEFELSGWRRSKFSSSTNGPAHLRLVFRKGKAGGVEILAFGDRDLPQSVYLSAKERA